jgi:hypothetical protein
MWGRTTAVVFTGRDFIDSIYKVTKRYSKELTFANPLLLEQP